MDRLVRLDPRKTTTAAMSDDVADRLRRGQLRGTVEQMRVMLLGNTLFAPILSFQAWGQGKDDLVLAWTAAIVLYSWWLFFAWRRTYRTHGSKADMQRFVIETFLNSLFWTVGMALFYPIVSGDQKAIVTTVMAGSLALGTMGFSRAPPAGLTYLAVQVVGNTSVAFGCWLHTGATSDLLIAVLMIAAGISLYNAAIERRRSSMVAFQDREALAEKSEVISLLLKDYEAQATEWLWQTDKNGLVTRAPARVLQILGLADADAWRAPLSDLILSACEAESKPDAHRLAAAIAAKKEFHDIQLLFHDPVDGTRRWILVKAKPQFDRRQFSGFRGIFADATVSVEAEQKVRYLANYDSLTTLLNRNSIHRLLRELNPKEQYATVFAIDLDAFKQVNDSYGHHFGDLLLQEVAARLQQLEYEGCVAARLSGDEFVMIHSGPDRLPTDKADSIATTICTLLAKPVEIGAFEVQVGASVGLACFPEDTPDGLELLTLADLALYASKKAGGGCATHFVPTMQEELNSRIVVIDRLKKAVSNDEICPYFQAQHTLCDGQLTGLEALARWTDKELGPVRPDIFIPIAEQTGLIVPLGEQLLRKSCKLGAKWFAEWRDEAPIISVNFSPIQFERMDVAKLVRSVLDETGLPPRLLEIEVTEGVLISSQQEIAMTLTKIAELGVSIALDDFGTGYSSLSYLNALPLNRLKVDRSFVMNLQVGSESPVVGAIIQLGHSLSLNVIAEGIETDDQLAALRTLGCDDGQGYLFGKAMTMAQTEDYLYDQLSGWRNIAERAKACRTGS